MKKLINKNNYSLLLIFLIIFLCNIVPLYGYSVYIYRTSYNTVKNMVIQSMTNESKILIGELKKQINNLWIRQHECALSRSANILVFPNISTYSYNDVLMAELDIQNYLSLICSNNDIVDNITVYFNEKGLEISSNNGIDDMNEDDKKQITSLMNTAKFNLVYENDVMYLITSNNYNILENEKNKNLPIISVISTISKRNILKKIESAKLVNSNSSKVVIKYNATDRIYVTNFETATLPDIERSINNYSMDKAIGYTTDIIDGTKYVVTYMEEPNLNFTLYEYMPEDIVFADLYNMNRLILLSIGLFAGTIIMFYYLSYIMFYKQTTTLLSAFRKVQEHNLSVKIKDKSYSSEFRNIFDSFNDMTTYLDDLVQKNYTSRILMQEAQLKQLQFQINPHFLYNSFFILNSMVRMEDYDNVEHMSNLLGTYLRYITYDTDENVPLWREIQHAKIYSDIQLIRFSRRLSVEFGELPEQVKNVSVPRMLIQPLLENSFIHGMRNVSENGCIRVKFNVNEDCVVIDVEDNGSELDASAISQIYSHINDEELDFNSEGIALLNISKRLKLKFGKNSGLYAYKSELGGLKISVVMQLAKEDLQLLQDNKI